MTKCDLVRPTPRSLSWDLAILILCWVLLPFQARGQQTITVEGREFFSAPTRGARVVINETWFSVRLPALWQRLTPIRDPRYLDKVPWSYPWLQGPEGDLRLRFAFRDKSFTEYFDGMDSWWRQLAAERHETFTPTNRTPVRTLSGISGYREEIPQPSNTVRYYFKNARGEAFEFYCNPHGKPTCL